MKMFLKYLLLFLVFMGLQIPLSMTESVVRERTRYREEAFDAVALMQGGEQVLISPVITIPVERTYWEESRNSEGNVQRVRKTSSSHVTLTPKSLTITQKQQVETRPKGIYQVPIYTADVTIKGQIYWPEIYRDSVSDEETVVWSAPIFSLALSQQTGIKTLSELKWADQTFDFKPGSDLRIEQGRGVHTPLPLRSQSIGDIPFELTISVRGTRALSVLPIAEKADVTIVSNWPHVRFSGAQLPDERQINSQGFSARWQSHALANNLPNQWQQCSLNRDCDGLLASQFGAQLIDPVDIYVGVDRAVKYGFLFLVVTFAAFVLYEVLYQLKIHPMQYVLVGLALTVFFLLLLSFAEQIGFNLAYLIAASACVTLLANYMKAALHSRSRLWAFVAILSMLYGALFVILQLEDFALMAGTIFLFILLALAMWLTRHVDWYQVQQGLQNKDKPTAAPVADTLVNDIRL